MAMGNLTRWGIEMSYKYGIFVHGIFDGHYAGRFASIEEAQIEAERVVRKHNVEVIVFEIIGEFAPSVKWTPQEGMK